MARKGLRRLLRLRFTARDRVDEVDDEVRLHVELRAAELVRQGLDPDEAAEEARRMFAADVTTLRALYATATERDRHMRAHERLESVVLDVRYALRMLRRDPLLTTFVVATLALGVGANTAAFGLVDRLLLRPPAHVVDADRVVRLYGELDFLGRGLRTSSYIPYAAYLQFRDVPAFEQVGAYTIGERYLGAGAEAGRVQVGQTLGAFFPLLGVQASRGRLFEAEEDAVTAGALAVLSHDVWHSRYGGDPGVVGRTIRVDDAPYTVVGVTPPGFTGTQARRVDVWVLGSSAAAGTRNWQIVGRLRPGVSAESAGAQATAQHRPETTGSFTWFRDVRVFAAPLNRGDDGRPTFEATLARWLAAVTAIILLITFANVVNLLLVRVARRRGELAVRLSLGSGRARVMRLVAAEGAVLALAGGAASLLVVAMVEPALRSALFADQAGWTFAFGDGRQLAIAASAVLLATVCVGVVPAWQAGDLRLASALRAGRHASPASARLRAALTVLQTALSVVLLVGAGLFLRSLANVNALDLGVDPHHVVTAEVTLPYASAADGSVRERALYRRLRDAVARVPGVERAAIAIGLPLDGGSFSAGVRLPGGDSLPMLPGGGPFVSSVDAGYFDAIGTRIVRGRAFSDADREGSEPVLVVNETMERALAPGGAALGRCVHVGDAASPCARIVGIAQDVHRVGLHEQPSLQYYIPLGQQSMFGGAKLVIRPAPGAPASVDALRSALVAADPAARLVEIRRLGAALEPELRPLRLGTVTFGISAALALVVALLGLYSLMSYLVAGRTREIGVRIALGATRSSIVGLVLRSGVALAATGVAIGLALALFAGRWLEPHLFEASARDAGVMTVVATSLLATAVLAGWLPARRAARIDPTEALRSE
jgi:predicted permease